VTKNGSPVQARKLGAFPLYPKGKKIRVYKQGSNCSRYVKENFPQVKKANPGKSHKELMAVLAENYKLSKNTAVV
jgi:hypothetical protein